MLLGTTWWSSWSKHVENKPVSLNQIPRAHVEGESQPLKAKAKEKILTEDKNYNLYPSWEDSLPTSSWSVLYCTCLLEGSVHRPPIHFSYWVPEVFQYVFLIIYSWTSFLKNSNKNLVNLVFILTIIFIGFTGVRVYRAPYTTMAERRTHWHV